MTWKTGCIGPFCFSYRVILSIDSMTLQSTLFISRFFIGTSVSTFSFRIHEEREILGFDPKTTYNRFCGDTEKECEQPTHWKIVYWRVTSDLPDTQVPKAVLKVMFYLYGAHQIFVVYFLWCQCCAIRSVVTTVTELCVRYAKTFLPNMYYCNGQQLKLHIFLGCMWNVDPSRQPGVLQHFIKLLCSAFTYRKYSYKMFLFPQWQYDDTFRHKWRWCFLIRNILWSFLVK